LEFDVTQTDLRFGDEIVDRRITAMGAVDHDLFGSWSGMLRIDYWRLYFAIGALRRRAST
jgi:hypothetical protein